MTWVLYPHKWHFQGDPSPFCVLFHPPFGHLPGWVNCQEKASGDEQEDQRLRKSGDKADLRPIMWQRTKRGV